MRVNGLSTLLEGKKNAFPRVPDGVVSGSRNAYLIIADGLIDSWQAFVFSNAAGRKNGKMMGAVC